MEDLYLSRNNFLLRSKIQVPPKKPDLVTRQDLLKKLDKLNDPQVSIILLLAPPGFGKSSLLNVWAHRQLSKIAWFTIEETENSPESFWMYFAAAIRGVLPNFIDPFSLKGFQPFTENLHEGLINLVNNIHQLDENLVIILEDFHNICNESILHDFTFLIEHLPRNLKLVISSQQEPALPLTKLKVNGSLQEIRTSDLEFSTVETQELLRKIGVQKFADEDVTKVVRQTEGWVFGILLAAIASSEKGRALSFDSANRSVSDYLVSEVLDVLPENTLNFLLEISVLDLVNADLCNYVTSRTDSFNLLSRLEQCNLFLLPLDEKKVWYRFHHSFLELLRSKLSLISETRIQTLHIKACEWYEKKGLVFAAFNHAMLAESYDQAIALVENNLFKMLDNSRLMRQSELVGQLPSEVLHTRPALAIANAWMLAYTGKIVDAEKNLSLAESIIARETDKGAQRRLTGKLFAVKSYISWLRGENEKTIKTALQGLIDLAPDDRMCRTITLISLGASFEDNGQSTEALEVYSEAVEMCNICDCRHVYIMAAAAKLRLMILLGQFSNAEAFGTSIINEVLRQNHEESELDNALGNIYAHLAEIHRIRYNLPKALEYAVKGSRLALNWEQADTSITTCGIEAAILWTIGKKEESLRLFAEQREQAALVSSWYLSYVEAYMILLGVDFQQLGGIPAWVNVDMPADEQAFHHHDVFFHRARVRVLCAQNRFADALSWLELIHRDLLKAGGRLMLLDSYVMLAICHFNMGNLTQATNDLTPALESVRTDCVFSIFLDKGDMVTSLLERLVFPPDLEVTVRTLSRMIKDRSIRNSAPGDPVREYPHFMQLSSREKEILILLATHKTSVEIAEMLTLSTNTIRFHIKSIYNKLDVHSRDNAVELGRELKLIE